MRNKYLTWILVGVFSLIALFIIAFANDIVEGIQGLNDSFQNVLPDNVGGDVTGGESNMVDTETVVPEAGEESEF